MFDNITLAPIHLILCGVSFVIGLAIGLLMNYLIKKDATSMGRAILEKTLPDSLKQFETIGKGIIEQQTLSGEKNLDTKKQLIDQTLGNMDKNLKETQELMKSLEKDRAQKYGELTNQLKNTTDETRKLQETTGKLNEALTNTQVRGQWGERMAEDILQLIGFIEGINYRKQQVQKTSSSRRDFTFLLPNELKVNMDVKFPLNNYLKFIEESNHSLKQKHKKNFLKDVKERIKEVNNRDYINPAENTVDYVIIFIPNEQIYGFINESDQSILEDALKNKVIVCSPLTLYAILSVIRQAINNFNLEKTTNKIIVLFEEFNKEWSNYTNKFEEIGKKLDLAQNSYNDLLSTRKRKLEKVVNEICALKEQNNIVSE